MAPVVDAEYPVCTPNTTRKNEERTDSDLVSLSTDYRFSVHFVETRADNEGAHKGRPYDHNHCLPITSPLPITAHRLPITDGFGEDNLVVVAQQVRIRCDHGGEGVFPRRHVGEGLGKHDAHLFFDNRLAPGE